MPILDRGAPPESSSTPSPGRGSRSRPSTTATRAIHTARVVVDLVGERRMAVIRHVDEPDGPTVGDLARRLGLRAGPGLTIDGRRVTSMTPLARAGVAQGSHLAATEAADGPDRPWVLTVDGGPETGRSWPLPGGASFVGPGPASDVRLDDMDRKDAATLHIESDGRTTVVSGDGVLSIMSGRPVALGSRTFTISARAPAPARPRAGPTVPVRPAPPTEDPRPERPPEPPSPSAPPTAPVLSWIGVLAPLALGGLVAAMWSPRFALFAAFGPVISVGTWLEQRRRHRRERQGYDLEIERSAAAHRTASTGYAEAAAAHARRKLPSLSALDVQGRVGGPRLWAGIPPITVSAGWDGEGPTAVTLQGRLVAIVGPAAVAVGVARHLLLQVAVAHPPSAVTIECPQGWDGHDTLDADWHRWLPHGATPRPAGGAETVVTVFPQGQVPTQPPRPAEGHLVVLSDESELPPWVDAAMVIETESRAVIHRSAAGCEDAGPVIRPAPVPRALASQLARHLARWSEVSDGPGDLTAAPFDLARLTGALDDVQLLIQRWHRSPPDGLTALVGVGRAGPVVIDLVRDGPHTVIGGTTGSGKSELLRTLVASLCLDHPPENLTFALIDYKGGSAFDGCVDLPHVTTVITDLDGSRTDRVLTAIDAELTRRERWLRDHGRSDLEAASGLPDRPPRLVVIIDEFATLAQDRPEFLPSLVDVARRGRSLGLHLVLATQRPAGAMTDDIRANTDLRIALRMVDAADSTDLIGVADAARLGADIPGRALVRRAGAPVEALQVAVTTSSAAPPVTLDVCWVDGVADEGRPAPTAGRGPTQLEQIVVACRAAVDRSGRSSADPLWPPELPTGLIPDDLVARVQGGADDGDGTGERSTAPPAVIGLADDLTATSHESCTWAPELGLLELHGGLGSDVSGVVTGVAALVHRARGPVHLYAVDGSGDLQDWLTADPVAAVVAAEDRDGIRRTLARLERALRPGSVAAESAAVVMVIHDLAAISRALDDLDGLRLLDRLHRLTAEGPAAGLGIIVTSPRPTALPQAIAGAVGRRLLLHVAQTDDYRLFGLRPPSSPLPAGRALDEQGVTVQLARLAPAALAAMTVTPAEDRPHRLVDLPDRVPAGEMGVGATDDPWALPVAIGHDGPTALTLVAGSATVVAGPPGSGRTTVLRTLAAEAGRRGIDVLAVVGPGSGDRHAVELADAATPTTADRLHRDLARAVRRSPHPDAEHLLVLVDDADDVEDPDGTLTGLARGRLRPEGVRLVVALDPVEARASYGHWTSSLRRCRGGIALHHDPDEDRDLWAMPLPPTPNGRRPPGRGLLMSDREDAVEIQVVDS